MVLVAASMVAILAMAALSIDAVTLYLANTEAQRSADAAALSAARILSISGMTGDPSNSTGDWQQACTLATGVATAVAQQNTMSGTAGSVTVTFPNNSDTANCTGTTAAFGVNPLVTVKVQRTDLPTFFARIWGRRTASVSATATAEAFNSSNSGNVGNNGDPDTITPVQPRCVKPWVVPNKDPGNAGGAFVDPSDGSLNAAGIRLNGAGTGTVGEIFSLFADCATGSDCNPPDSPLKANVSGGSYNSNPAPTGNNLEYVPGQVPSTSAAVPSCATDSGYQKAVGGCDQTVYQCSVANGETVNLDENPGGGSGDTATAAQCLIHQAAVQDTLDTTAYPFQIKAGAGNPLGLSGKAITSSNSIVSLPIYDTASAPTFSGGGSVTVKIVGFLQVFINSVDTTNGSVNVTVLNVTGCGNGSHSTGTAVTGSSPVPVRLITPP